MKKSFTYSIVAINIITNGYFWWLSWSLKYKLPENLGEEMSIGVILSKYQTVRADFSAWMTVSCVVMLILVNALMIQLYYKKKKVSPRDEPRLMQFQ